MNENLKTGISFSFRRRRVLIFRSTLRSLGVPSNIRFLLNTKRKKVAVQACEAIDRDSFKVPDFTNRNKDQYEITSQQFLMIIYKMAEWEKDKTYRISGMVYPDNRLVEFNLGDACVINDEEFVDPESE